MRSTLAKVVFVDNFDSFTYNIVHALKMLGAEVEVVTNTAQPPIVPSAIVIGPGPGAPSRAGISKQIIETASVPLLGICLGHQAMGEVYGARVQRARRPMHGKISPIHHNQTGLFKGLPTPFQATRYHSLIIDELPPELQITAWTEENEIMAIEHRTKPQHGVQFHPESIASEQGMALLENFLTL